MSKNKTIYELDLHERLDIEGTLVTRVPGGWIYESLSDDRDIIEYRPVFVPFNNEYIERYDAKGK